jgi:hypothetical protein
VGILVFAGRRTPPGNHPEAGAHDLELRPSFVFAAAPECTRALGDFLRRRRLDLARQSGRAIPLFIADLNLRPIPVAPFAVEVFEGDLPRREARARLVKSVAIVDRQISEK